MAQDRASLPTWTARIACAVLIAAAATSALAADKVSFGMVGQNFTLLPVYVARGAKLFEQEGIVFEAPQLNAAATAVAAVISGGVDIYPGSPAVAMQARERGQDVLIWGQLDRRSQINLIVKKDRVDARKLSDGMPVNQRMTGIKGLKISVVGVGSITDQTIRYMARNAGMDPDRDLTIVPGGDNAGMLAAFSQNRVDAVFTSPPTTEKAMGMGGYRLISVARGDVPELSRLPIVTLVSRGDWLRKNPDLAARTARALANAQRMLHESPDQAMAAVRPFFADMDEGTFRTIFRGAVPAFQDTVRVDREALVNQVKFLTEATGKTPKVNLDSVFTNEYVDLAEKKAK